VLQFASSWKKKHFLNSVTVFTWRIMETSRQSNAARSFQSMFRAVQPDGVCMHQTCESLMRAPWTFVRVVLCEALPPYGPSYQIYTRSCTKSLEFRENPPMGITHCSKGMQRSPNDSRDHPALIYSSYRTRQSASGSNPVAAADQAGFTWQQKPPDLTHFFTGNQCDYYRPGPEF
jgi:hypothetical protein